ETQLAPPAPKAIWRIPADIGRRYAAVSGDRNPIHLYPATAKLLGFPKAIAHGMWTKAHSLAAFEGRLPDAFELDVRFKLPVLLPAKAAFTSWQVEDGFAFELWDARTPKPYLQGGITARPPGRTGQPRGSQRAGSPRGSQAGQDHRAVARGQDHRAVVRRAGSGPSGTRPRPPPGRRSRARPGSSARTPARRR